MPHFAAPDMGSGQPWRSVDGGVRLSVRLTPKASRDRIGGVGDGPDGPHLVVKVRALPSEGAANRALEKLVAQWLGLPQRDVVLAKGGKSRLKSVRVAGDPAAIADLLRAKLASA